ncbi:hypothetical protein [Paractinoplanes maris]|uniref:hypothetical protein n=1 Tax=Paractinoplanes maris TaxID=1734446 RepID=UPI00202266AB|nr:hypothetical protein [Actinoplanes maris]
MMSIRAGAAVDSLPSKVTPMPRFLRALSGDAKPTSRGSANARAMWTCSGAHCR